MKHNKTYKTNSQPPHQLNTPQMGPNGPIWTDAQKSTTFPDEFDFSGPYFFPATQKSYLPNFARNKKFFPRKFFFEIFENFKNFPNFRKIFMNENFEISAHSENFRTPHGPPKRRFQKIQLFSKNLSAFKKIFDTTEKPFSRL